MVVDRKFGNQLENQLNFGEMQRNKQPFKFSREHGFFALLGLILFLATVFDKKDPSLGFADFCFFFNYLVAALLISYVFVPRLLYKKKYLPFIIATLLTLGVTLYIEEFVLEQIFYPDTKGKFYLGIIRTLFDIIPTISIFVGFKLGWDAQVKQSELEQLNARVAESQLQFLQSQINPHFLFNNLNNLYSYTLENSPKTPQIILELSGLLRYMLYDCKEPWVLLEKEVDYLANFIRLQELQMEGKGTVNFHITGNLSGHRVAPLLFVVFVENSFKHSLSSMTEQIVIDIDLKIVDNKLYFSCINNYSEQANTEKLSHGIGLENVQTRLKLLYPDVHTLSIQSTEDQYRVDLILDLNAAKK